MFLVMNGGFVTFSPPFVLEWGGVEEWGGDVTVFNLHNQKA